MRKFILGGIAALFVLAAVIIGNALAQNPPTGGQIAQLNIAVTPTCNAQSLSSWAGVPFYKLYMDYFGNLCTNGTGGGGGGAVTIADGADVTQGAIGDAAATAGGTGTVSAKLREATSLLNSILAAINGPWPAGENHGGQVGGLDTRVVTTPTVTAGAYAASNCVGGFNAVTIARINGGNGLLTNVMLMSKTGLTPTLTVYLFNSNPSSSTCTDKSTFTLDVADLGKLIVQPFALSLLAPQGSTPSMAELANMARPFIAGGSSGSGVQTIYFALVAGGAFTPASTSELLVSIGADLN